MTREEIVRFIKRKCPDCQWSEFKDGEVVGMTPCHTCNSTGYTYGEIKECQVEKR